MSITDVETGDEFVCRGDLITGLRASSRFPGTFEPVRFGGYTLADDGSTNTPVNAAASCTPTSPPPKSDETPPAPRRSRGAGGGPNETRAGRVDW